MSASVHACKLSSNHSLIQGNRWTADHSPPNLTSYHFSKPGHWPKKSRSGSNKYNVLPSRAEKLAKPGPLESQMGWCTTRLPATYIFQCFNRMLTIACPEIRRAEDISEDTYYIRNCVARSSLGHMIQLCSLGNSITREYFRRFWFSHSRLKNPRIRATSTITC